MWIGHFIEFKSWCFKHNSPSSEKLEELWVVCEFIFRKWSLMLLVGIWWQENKNKLVKWKAFVDTLWLKSAYLKENFCSGVILPVREKNKTNKHLIYSKSGCHGMTTYPAPIQLGQASEKFHFLVVKTTFQSNLNLSVCKSLLWFMKIFQIMKMC